ncbi:TPA: GntR family transcriptional regulator, partial [Bacillus anthracis]|nr:GntR family transcriptional regulator [Bacillus anthracis]
CCKGSERSRTKKRQNTFMTEYLPKVWEEAKVLEISKDELMDMIQKITKEGKEG